MKGKLFAVFCLLVLPTILHSQETAGPGAETVVLPRQFRQIALGMSLDGLKDALLEDALFAFRGDRDVSFIPVREESLVETTGSSFVRRAFFQLRDGGLFIISLSMNTALVDYHSMFVTFTGRYGDPILLNPRESVWDDGTTRISLERPLTVRYIDRAVFDDIVNESLLVDSRRVQEKQEFLDEF
ncbi:MAG: hypothetical protein FWD94_02495 [Treponema sp.]|nr:hypothetical protein [Treponema sp.]